jgi:hypothetical protein
MNAKLRCAFLAVIAAVASAPATAADVGVAGAFGQGRTHFFVSGGTGYAFNETYFVLGLGVSYYVVNGLNVGLALESWTGADPKFYRVTPSVQYVFYQVPVVKPYVGAFYRRTYYSDGIPDIDSTGGRAGVYVQAGRSAYLGAGAVYESYLDCNKAVYRSCTNTYPELSFTVAF